MSTIIRVNGTPIDNEIRITSMSPPHAKGKWVHHHLPLINSGYTKFMGYESTRSTIDGYFPRKESLREIVANLESSDTVEIEDSFWGTADWYVTNVSFSDSTSWIRFSCNLIRAD